MKRFGIFLTCAVVVTGLSGNVEAAVKHRHATTASHGVEPQGAERQKQFEWATRECQKRFGGAYGNHVRAQWTSGYGSRGWFCVFNR